MSYILQKINDNELEFHKNKNFYDLLYNNKKIQLLSPKIKIPFGIENFGNNLILNLELINNDNNKMYNFTSIIKSLDTFLKNQKSIVNNNLENLLYVSCIKNRPEPFNPLLRTKIKKYGKKIITEIISECKSKTLYDINKNSYISVLLKLDNVWINNGKYGMNWTVEKIYI